MLNAPLPRFRTRLLAWTSVIIMAGGAGAFPDAEKSAAGPGDTAKAWMDRGDAHLDAKEYDKAIVEYTRAIELKPDLAEAYNNRAYACYSKYDGTGNPLADLNRAIELRPDFAHAYNTRG